MTRKQVNSRKSSVVHEIELLDDPQVQRDAKRIQRQQKRLEKTTGIATITNLQTRARVVKFEDLKIIKPMTDTQRVVFNALEDESNMAFVLYGSAGTGKTFLAMYHGLQEALDPQSCIDKVVVIRSAVQTRDQGYVKGDNEMKNAPYEMPYIGICDDLFGRKDAYEKLKDMGKIEFHTSAFLRGNTFHNAFIIFDESQSATWHELSTVLTRVGDNSKIAMCGDHKQNDLIKSRMDVSGFGQLMKVAEAMESIRCFKFTPEDCVRSGFVREFLMTCDRLDI